MHLSLTLRGRSLKAPMHLCCICIFFVKSTITCSVSNHISSSVAALSYKQLCSSAVACMSELYQCCVAALYTIIQSYKQLCSSAVACMSELYQCCVAALYTIIQSYKQLCSSAVACMSELYQCCVAALYTIIQSAL
jgi:hypothetical protein